jgi:FkbM family methyltransferase
MSDAAPMNGRRRNPSGSRVRALVRRSARRAGVEQQMLSAYETALRAFEAPATRRNRRDDERTRLVAAAVLAADSNCVDVGANEGGILTVFTTLAPLGRHIAYEPLPDLSASLVRRFPRVDVRAAAVSNRCGESTFVVHKRLPTRSSLRPVGYDAAETESIRVPVTTLDDSLPAGYVPDLLKVDVEGAEHLVLEGARATLAAHRPVVLFEHQRSTAAHYGSGPSAIFKLLCDELEMRVFDLDGSGPYSLARLQQTYERGTRLNFFAVPAERRGPGRG